LRSESTHRPRFSRFLVAVALVLFSVFSLFTTPSANGQFAVTSTSYSTLTSLSAQTSRYLIVTTSTYSEFTMSWQSVGNVTAITRVWNGSFLPAPLPLVSCGYSVWQAAEFGPVMSSETIHVNYSSNAPTDLYILPLGEAVNYVVHLNNIFDTTKCVLTDYLAKWSDVTHLTTDFVTPKEDQYDIWIIARGRSTLPYYTILITGASLKPTRSAFLQTATITSASTLTGTFVTTATLFSTTTTLITQSNSSFAAVILVMLGIVAAAFFSLKKLKVIKPHYPATNVCSQGLTNSVSGRHPQLYTEGIYLWTCLKKHEAQ
jgi:hypothetical protein